MHIRPAAFALLACLLQSAPASPTSGEPIRYHVGFDRDAKTWSVAMTIPLPKAAPFELWIPRWTPGAYHLADFAQNVTTLSAADASGNSMKVTRHEPVVFWTIDPGAATRAVVNYQATPPKEGPLAVLDALEASAIAKTRANVTPCSLLAFVPEWKDRPVEVELDLPADWTVATALDRRADGVFTAPSYLRLEDSPFLMGRRLQVEAFEASGARHEVATLGKTEEETKELAGECEKIVESASRMMGGVPYRRYVFLFGFVGGGGGLEHSYSTLI
ncbi:MAG TPA: hypothetical protein VKE69_03890, partial [Planctomycetota bacterium]|nr:hypothetical protein [Planctomycetota bacterium]